MEHSTFNMELNVLGIGECLEHPGLPGVAMFTMS